MRTIIAAASIACACLSTVVAQSPPANHAADLPEGPLIKAAPAYAHWVAITKLPAPPTASTGGADQVGDKSPQTRRTITKTGDIRKEDMVDGLGASSETWKFGGYAVTFTNDSETPLVAIAGTGKPDDVKTDFPGFEWISPRNFAGISKLQGRDCLTFRGVSNSGPDTMELESVAAIDLKSRLPVYLLAGEETTTYEYLPAPEAKLILPDKVKKVIQAWKAHTDSLKYGPARPF